jgi:hypothetical protein
LFRVSRVVPRSSPAPLQSRSDPHAALDLAAELIRQQQQLLRDARRDAQEDRVLDVLAEPHHALGQHREQLDGRVGMLAQDAQELAALEHEHLGGLERADARGALPADQQRQLAHHFARVEQVQDDVVALARGGGNLEAATRDHVDLGGRIALVEEHLAGGEAPRRRGGSEHVELLGREAGEERHTLDRAATVL